MQGAAIAAACICEKKQAAMRENARGILPVWFLDPPFRVNHLAKHTLELEWEDESGKNGSKLVPVHLKHLHKGKYLTETGQGSSPDLEMSIVHLREGDFRVEHDGVSMTVSISVYQKDQTEHIHIWHGSCHHHFRRNKGLDLGDIDESTHLKTAAPDSSSYPNPRGTVVARMPGLVVRVHVKDGVKVAEGHATQFSLIVFVVHDMSNQLVTQCDCVHCTIFVQNLSI